MPAATVSSSFITQKVLNEKTCYYSILKSYRNKLQEYVMKNRGSIKKI